MNLKEANERLYQEINIDQLSMLETLYYILDFDKDDFCNVVNVLGGVDKILAKYDRYKRYEKAERLMSERERYEDAKDQYTNLMLKKDELEKIISTYEQEFRCY